ncbi:MAG: hypothetical protein ACR2Q4_00160 [Geminicoccaceae bacterium]
MLILAPESIAKTFTLTIDGDQGASFVGSCLAVRGDEQDVLALSGQAPFEQAVEADFMSCRFNATGRISIKATSDAGQERMVETKNGVITLSLR